MTRIKSLKVEHGYSHRVHRKKRRVYQTPGARKLSVARKKRLEQLKLKDEN